jgi:selenocysteine-specific elongation factor
VSSHTGEGLPELRRALAEALSAVAPRGAGAGFRLPIDRSFALLGIGCVITGTVWSGSASVGEELELLPPGLRLKIRQIQAHEQPVQTALVGQRTAVNLAGVKAHEVLRGHTLVTPGAFKAWPYLDAELYLLPSVAKPLKSFQRVRVHLGTASTFARVVLARGTVLAPGGRAFCQLRLEEPLVGARGDRFVVRQESPVVTLGGGTLLLPDAARLRSGDTARFDDLARLARGDLAETVRVIFKWSGYEPPAREALVPAAGASAHAIEDALAALIARGALAALGGGKLLERSRLEALEARIRAELDSLHRQFPAKPQFPFLQLAAASKGVPEALLAQVLGHMASAGALVEARGGFALAGRAPKLTAEETHIRAAIAAEHDAHPFSPEGPNVVAAALRLPEEKVVAQYRLLVEGGDYTQIAPGVFFRNDALERCAAAIRALAARMGAFAVKDFRDELGTSRKHAVPLLEYFDKQHLTARRPDSTRTLAPGAK